MRFPLSFTFDTSQPLTNNTYMEHREITTREGGWKSIKSGCSSKVLTDVTHCNGATLLTLEISAFSSPSLNLSASRLARTRNAKIQSISLIKANAEYSLSGVSVRQVTSPISLPLTSFHLNLTSMLIVAIHRILPKLACLLAYQPALLQFFFMYYP